VVASRARREVLAVSGASERACLASATGRVALAHGSRNRESVATGVGERATASVQGSAACARHYRRWVWDGHAAQAGSGQVHSGISGNTIRDGYLPPTCSVLRATTHAVSS
jgi:hypothetical protein